MAPITVQPPTESDIAQFPREFALYTQLKPTADGAVDAEALGECVKTYGSGESLPASFSSGSVPFELVAAALVKKGSTVDGSGNCLGYAAHDNTGHLVPWKFERRPCAADDVRIQVTHCGICHSDLHQLKNDWMNSTYPMVPGHEIVGIVTEVGSGVTTHKVGDRVGVGCLVRSCGSCRACSAKEEEFCGKMVFTYNSQDHDGSPTYGGYSTHLVVDKSFVLRVPENLPLDAAAPLLCAGITTYTPLVHWGLNKPGTRLGVIGLGGLGHMAVKLGKAFGCHVTVISTSPGKKQEALEVLKADDFLISKDEEAMKGAYDSLDGIIDTVSAPHELRDYLPLLRFDGRFIIVGAPMCDMKISPFELLFKRLTVAGSLIGGIQATQEMLDFCGKHNITCEIEKIPAEYLNTAMDRLVKNDVHYRFVIDVQGTLLWQP